jgi:hypothetical protein
MRENIPPPSLPYKLQEKQPRGRRKKGAEGKGERRGRAKESSLLPPPPLKFHPSFSLLLDRSPHFLERGTGGGGDGEGRREVPGVGGRAGRRSRRRLRRRPRRSLPFHAGLRLQLPQAATQPPGTPSPHVILLSPFPVAVGGWVHALSVLWTP